MSDASNQDLDDTVETSLADELLATSRDTERSGVGPRGLTSDIGKGVPSGPDTADAGPPIEEDDYLASTHRSPVTTGLVIALVFAIGALCGVLLARALTPTPPPQIVYVLNTAGSADSTPTPASTTTTR